MISLVSYHQDAFIYMESIDCGRRESGSVLFVCSRYVRVSSLKTHSVAYSHTHHYRSMVDVHYIPYSAE